MSPQLCSTALVALNGLQAMEDQDAIVSSPMPYSSHTQAFSDLHQATFQCKQTQRLWGPDHHPENLFLYPIDESLVIY